jgi:hypothetical protein
MTPLEDDFDLDDLEPTAQLTLEIPNNRPMYLGNNYIQEGTFSIPAPSLKGFYDNALHLDKKDTDTCITLTVVNNLCFVYSINLGIELTATFGCVYESATPLVVTLPINKILKLLNTDEMVTFTLTEDTITISRNRMEVSIMRVNSLFIKESDRAIKSIYNYYDSEVHDQFENNALYEMVTTMNAYAKLNPADKRIILLDGSVAYVKSIGYYVHKSFPTNQKYLINGTLANLLAKLCKSDLESFEIKVILTEDAYVILAHNYTLVFPMLNGDCKFTLLDKIQPVTAYQFDKKEFKLALSQIDMYNEKKCAITLGDTVSLQNKTVQGTAYVELHSQLLQDMRQQDDRMMQTYLFDYNKLTRVLAPIKTDELVIMECNTREHLYLADAKTSCFVILSVK